MTDRYMSDHKDRMEHSEVEGLVEEHEARARTYEAMFLPQETWDGEKWVVNYVWQGEGTPREYMLSWLRTALTSYGAKEYERGLKEGKESIAVKLRDLVAETRATLTTHTDVTK